VLVAQEIERLEGVQSTVVLYLERTDRLVACCVATAEASQIREACFGQLPPYALPDEVVVVESFPLLPSGKIDRQTLQTRLETAVV
jgi:acyl-CoA synthetase (AMP-forming)/AMP-acid ligase II